MGEIVSSRGPVYQTPSRLSRRTVLLVLEGMRPKQWLKNSFVLAGVIFSGHMLDLGSQIAAWVTVVAYCFASGATYLFNDACDHRRDALSSRTARRPVARGDLTVRQAYIAAGIAALAALCMVAPFGFAASLTVCSFLLLQLVYSLKLKHLLFLDVLAIATGFVLRALAGLFAIDARLSPWLLLGSGLLALFLALGKRRGEVAALAGDPAALRNRPVLSRYSLVLLDRLLIAGAAVAVALYCAYAIFVAPTRLMLLTVPFVVLGIVRTYISLHSGKTVSAGDPTLMVWRDSYLLVVVCLWALLAGSIAAIYS